MSTNYPPTPSPDARLAALEKLYLSVNARIELLSQDIDKSFKQADQYHEKRYQEIEEGIEGIKTEVIQLKTEVLNAFSQLLNMIDSRLPDPGQKGL
jgi:archaellum component FlaC